MILKRASFYDIVAAGAEYHPPSRPRESSVEIPYATITDTPDDFVILDNAVLTPPVGVAWRGFWLADAIQYMGGGPKWKTANWLPGRYDSITDTIALDPSWLTPDLILKETSFYVDSTIGGYNFGHFVQDMLPYGLLFRRIRHSIDRMRPLIAPLKLPHQEKLFQVVFDFPYKDCVRPANDRPILIERLIVPRRQTNFDGSPWQLSFAGVRHIRDAAVQRWWGVDRLPSAVED